MYYFQFICKYKFHGDFRNATNVIIEKMGPAPSRRNDIFQFSWYCYLHPNKIWNARHPALDPISCRTFLDFIVLASFSKSPSRKIAIDLWKLPPTLLSLVDLFLSLSIGQELVLRCPFLGSRKNDVRLGCFFFFWHTKFEHNGNHKTVVFKLSAMGSDGTWTSI